MPRVEGHAHPISPAPRAAVAMAGGLPFCFGWNVAPSAVETPATKLLFSVEHAQSPSLASLRQPISMFERICQRKSLVLAARSASRGPPAQMRLPSSESAKPASAPVLVKMTLNVLPASSLTRGGAMACRWR